MSAPKYGTICSTDSQTGCASGSYLAVLSAKRPLVLHPPTDLLRLPRDLEIDYSPEIKSKDPVVRSSQPLPSCVGSGTFFSVSKTLTAHL